MSLGAKCVLLQYLKVSLVRKILGVCFNIEAARTDFIN